MCSNFKKEGVMNIFEEEELESKEMLKFWAFVAICSTFQIIGMGATVVWLFQKFI